MSAVSPCRRECGYVNRFTQHECATCGAVRWDGAGGQLRARLAAVLQTADLSSTSSRQVLALQHFGMRHYQVTEAPPAGRSLFSPAPHIAQGVCHALCERPVAAQQSLAAPQRGVCGLNVGGCFCASVYIHDVRGRTARSWCGGWRRRRVGGCQFPRAPCAQSLTRPCSPWVRLLPAHARHPSLSA